MNYEILGWLIVLTLFNLFAVAPVVSFFKEVIDWWRPWAGVLILVPPLSLILALLIFVIGICALAISYFMDLMKKTFTGLFTSHPPDSEKD